MEDANTEAGRVSRRNALLLAGGAALLGGALTAGAAQADSGKTPPGAEIAGAWSIINSVFGPRYAVYTADGGSIAIQADATRTAQLGTWIQTGDREYLLRTFSIRLDDQGNAAGTVDLRLDLTLDPTGNSYSGQLVQRELDSAGNLVSATNATAQATRITAIPLDEG